MRMATPRASHSATSAERASISTRLSVWIGHRHRRGGNPVDVEGLHLQLGEGPPHAVPIDHRKTTLGAHQEGYGRVRSSGLEGDDGVRALPAETLFQAPRAPTPAHRRWGSSRSGSSARPCCPPRSPAPRRRARRGRGVQSSAAPAHRLRRHQPPNIGIAAPAGAQHRRAAAQIFEIGRCLILRAPSRPSADALSLGEAHRYHRSSRQHPTAKRCAPAVPNI